MQNAFLCGFSRQRRSRREFFFTLFQQSIKFLDQGREFSRVSLRPELLVNLLVQSGDLRLILRYHGGAF